ncbi:MAG: RNA-binding protein [Chlamydiia bacterium]
MSQNKKLYVGSLPYSITEEQLKDVFVPYGAVVSVRIVTDKFTGKSKGFGFVEMETPEAAQKAIDAVHGSDVGGRTLVVNIAHPEQKRTGGGFQNSDRKRGSWQNQY